METKLQKQIDATRGKPNATQLALCDEMLKMPLAPYLTEDGTDVRNYGGFDGIPEMKRIFAELLGVDDSAVIVGGNSSLNMMYDFIATMLLIGKWKSPKFICPVPGYDRHFSVCAYLGMEMLTVPMKTDGPDMDIVEDIVKNNADVAGIWCVPVFSNPQGYVYSDETVRRLAAMRALNADFKIIWDNAYTVHNFIGERPHQLNILDECKKNGNASRPVLFTSFSKISFAGAAVACAAAAGETLEIIRKRISMQTVGPDKINQLRHVQYFKNVKGVEEHMKKHAEILRPKFELAHKFFTEKLKGTRATFTAPKGGYFISVETPGNAKYVRQICKDAGVLITEAGATFPYGKDPADSNIRFAPSYLSMEELEQALDVFCKAVHVAEASTKQ